METVAETWRPVHRFPHYEASSLGRVRSVDRIVLVRRKSRQYMRRRKGQLMKQTMHHSGYLCVNVCEEALPTMAPVHQLVADAFHGERREGLTVNHINGNKRDNRPENLEYVTIRENLLHGYRTGIIKNHGEHNRGAKLTEEEVREIRGSNLPASELSLKFGIGSEQVWRVQSRRNWKHIA